MNKLFSLPLTLLLLLLPKTASAAEQLQEQTAVRLLVDKQWSDWPLFKKADSKTGQPLPKLFFAKRAKQTSLQIPFEVTGELDDVDATFDDGSLYERYSFTGQAGQIVKILLTSEAFDTQLFLVDADNQRLADNDDSNDSTNSELVMQLPETGTYSVLATTYSPDGRGSYGIKATAGTETEAKAFEAERLNQAGLSSYRQARYREALELFEQALTIRREISDRASEGVTLSHIGLTYDSLGQYPQALDYYEQSLVILREIDNRMSEGVILNNIGRTYHSLGQYPQALDYSEQSLVILREIGGRTSKGVTLNNIGAVYRSLGQYPQALDYYEQSLVILREIGDRTSEGVTLNNIGAVYHSLGQHPQALNYYEQSLVICREISDRDGEGVTLNNIGHTYDNLGQYPRALNYYEQSLVIRREISDRAGEGATLNNIGRTYDNLGQYPRALSYYEQSLAIFREIGDRAGEGATLNNIGRTYDNLGQYVQALDYYEQSLLIRREISDRAGEGATLNNIGLLLKVTEEAELAIIFLKQSVNVYETIRKDNLTLSPEQQQSYTETIADTYRKLADLLLQANRVLEAQAVLELLKLQELDESLGNVQRSGLTEGVGYWEIEDEVLRLYTEILIAGQELARLQDPANRPLSEADKARRNELQDRQQELRTSFNEWLDHPEVSGLIAELQASSDRQVVDLQNQYAQLQRELRELPQTSVILYPLILEERLELVLITPNAPPVRYPVDVTADDLKAAVTAYGQILKSPHKPAEPLAQKLYSWLIAPIAADLEKIDTETIIYAPDGVLRYLPLAALHDGENWLAQTYSISQITSASLTSFGDRPSNQRQVLAAACAECAFSFDIAGRSTPFEFANLPATETEVSILADQIPDTTILLNDDFSPDTLQDELASYNILHLATHAAFVPERPKESFVVFGNEERVTLETIRTEWGLTNADLFVLSACETAVGNIELGTGIEILGMGFQLQIAGAKAALASLWQVSDGGTQILMNAFYAALNQGLTKAAALQAAQIAMITDNYPAAVGGERATLAITNERGQPLTIPDDMSHPYYWAPFILIGNGL
ncbi:tetratricopeptide repeat protein [Leptolyngbya cf. ectocarpi LEGE 11479]|uniref:Tetratricopeptide repeat protein n=1 Tax=Leptolyngbya cf. ectocarpi LEGE 11479 TaxID=1828722 RepID=A0A928ZT96_LEPEC|nr:tetratricopeptide repeat protein [Leptolyngbya ectocarpi]MBE9066776.1 tetratricopeptide repeat protein [Leptolyngbya cf. ectocarpi LEGE 11479]